MVKNKKSFSTFIKVVIGIILAVLLVVLGYVLYVVCSYHRIPDKQELTIEAPVETVAGEKQQENTEKVKTDTEYSIMTYNVGFGAYTPDFSFFMDGGKSSVAESKESVIATITGAGALLDSYNPDFIMIEEVDLNATRSYHVNQYEMFQKQFPSYYTNFAVNYDSAFLFYPITEPHGKSRAGIAVFSKYEMESALRRSLPIATSFNKFIDLDRCYSITRIPMENGKQLCLYAVHLSAYGNSDAIREGQVTMLCDDMQADYEAGNYVICGGDFNHDLKDKDGQGEGTFSWAQPFPREYLPEGFAFGLDSFSDAEKEGMHDSARNADMAYEEGVTFTITLDGFIISDNIVQISYEQIDTGYAYSDHDPVFMKFILK